MKELSAETYSLAEAIADIAFTAGYHRYYSGDSREDISSFVYWAQEFEEKYKGVKWGTEGSEGQDYMEAIEAFAEDKIKLKKNQMATPVYIPASIDINMIILTLITYRDTFKESQVGYLTTQKQIDQLKLLNLQHEAAIQQTHS